MGEDKQSLQTILPPVSGGVRTLITRPTGMFLTSSTKTTSRRCHSSSSRRSEAASRDDVLALCLRLCGSGLCAGSLHVDEAGDGGGGISVRSDDLLLSALAAATLLALLPLPALLLPPPPPPLLPAAALSVLSAFFSLHRVHRHPA